MDDEIERAIQLLISMLTRSMKSEDAYKLTQSALHLAHVKSVLTDVALGIPRERKAKTA